MQESLFYINRQLISSLPSQATLETYPNVTLQQKNLKVIQLTLHVTNYRLLFHSVSEHSFLIEGSRIKEATIEEEGILWGKEYFLSVLTDYGKVRLTLKNYKEAQVNVLAMVRNKQWTKMPAKVEGKGPAPQMYSGMFDKIEKQKQKIDNNAVKVGESFTSFQSLFGNLRDIKQAMKQMRAISTDIENQNTELNEILKDIGFVSATSKQQSGGKNFIRQLAKDLYNICTSTLFKKYGGVVSLLDLFYLYNMTRQTQLVSPEELLKACEKFQKYGYKAQLVTYPNNLKMVESTEFDQKEDFERNFRQFFQGFGQGRSGEEIARKKNLPLTIVEIKLRKACRRGLLAVDNRIEGTKYYANLLLTL